MISFKAFLESQEQQLIAERDEREDRVARWRRAIERLFKDVQDWLADSDPHQIVDTRFRTVDAASPRTDGRRSLPYAAPSYLEIAVGERFVRLIPETSNIMGPRWKPGEGRWLGLITMWTQSFQYEILLFDAGDSGDHWFIRNTKNYEMRPLDRAAFEAALVELLS